MQTYGTNLPTSLTYFLLFHQRLLTSETCCGHRYGLASLSTTSVCVLTRTTTVSPQQQHQHKHHHQLCSSRFSRRNHKHSSTITLTPMSPQMSDYGILHFLPLLQSIHFLGTPNSHKPTCPKRAHKLAASWIINKR